MVLEGAKSTSSDLEVEAYALRRRISRYLDKYYGKFKHYAASMSTKTITYKGMVVSNSLAEFYQDLKDEDYKT